MGKLSRETGQSRVPEPPDRMTGTIFPAAETSGAGILSVNVAAEDNYPAPIKNKSFEALRTARSAGEAGSIGQVGEAGGAPDPARSSKAAQNTSLAMSSADRASAVEVLQRPSHSVSRSASQDAPSRRGLAIPSSTSAVVIPDT